MMKLPKINQSQLPILGVGAVAGVLLYMYLSKQNIIAANSRAASSFFSGETTYYPGDDSQYGANAQGLTYLRSNTIPTLTAYPPHVIKNGINAIWRENLETG